MRQGGWIGCVMVGGSLVGASAAAAGGPDLDARIAAIEAQIAELKNDHTSWLTAEETRGLVSEALADSETRSSLLQNGALAGFREGKGFFLSNEDGSFDVNLYLYTQFRAAYNDRQSPDRSTFGFEESRTVIGATGHAGSPDLTYAFQAAFDKNGGALVLDDAKFAWNLGGGWQWGWGQGKAPFMREDLLGDTNTLAVERSYVHALTTINRTQGTWLNYRGDIIDFWISFNDGVRPSVTGANTLNKNTAFGADGVEWAVTSRLQALIGGSWSQFSDWTTWSTDDPGLLLGAAVHWQDGEYGTGPDELETLMWTVDASLEMQPAHLAGYVVGLHTSPNDSALPGYDQIGFVVQGGYHLVPDKFELFGRYEWYDFDGAVAGVSVDAEVSLLALGFNYYFRRHGWKWTTDWVYAFDQIPAAGGAQNLLADAMGDDGQWAIRSQMQIFIP